MQADNLGHLSLVHRRANGYETNMGVPIPVHDEPVFLNTYTNEHLYYFKPDYILISISIFYLKSDNIRIMFI